MSRVRRKRHRQLPAEQAPATGNEFEAIVAACWTIVQQYARPCPPTMRPMRCIPSVAERAGEVPRRNQIGNDGKVIYDSREAAESAIAEMTALGMVAQRSYHCPRQTTTGHWHVTTDGHGARRAKDQARKQVAS